MRVFAHRGASALAMENTLDAFQLALESCCYGIELDIYSLPFEQAALGQTHELLVFHDRTLDRLMDCEQHNPRFTDLSVEQAQNLRFRSPQAAQASIPSLKDVFALVQGRCVLNIELKNKPDLTLLYQQLEYAQTHCQFAPEQLLISSFDHELLAELAAAYPHLRLGVLTATTGSSDLEFALRIGAVSLHLDINALSELVIQQALQAQLEVYVYTVDHSADIAYLQQKGVTGIFANHPLQAMSFL